MPQSCFFLFQLFEEAARLPVAVFILSLPVAKSQVAAGWLITVCAVGLQCTAPPPQLCDNLQIQPDSSAGHGTFWDALLKCYVEIDGLKSTKCFSCLFVIFCSNSPDKISFLLSLLSFSTPSCFYLPCGGACCASLYCFTFEIRCFCTENISGTVLQSNFVSICPRW